MVIRRVKKKIPKLNLIPILDSVFIFIFFLLMSTQFIEIYQIGSEAPSIKTVDTENNDDEPLNLVLDIQNNHIKVLTGISGDLRERIGMNGNEYDFLALQKILYEIKVENKDETTIRLRPHQNISYDNIVKVIDSSRKIGLEYIEDIDPQEGSEEQEVALFEEVIFENFM